MKILILANNDVGLYKFRKELILELLNPGTILEERIAEESDLYISLPYGEFVDELTKMGCKYLETSIERRGMNPFKDLKLLNEYRKMIRQIAPDVVLTYTIKPNIYGGLACRLLKVPYLVNITGLGTSIENQGLLSKIILQMYKVGIGAAKTVFFQNASNAKLFKEKRIVRDNVELIPGSGVNLQEHCFENYPSEKNGIKLLFIGRIMRDKGISEYLDCAEHYSERKDVSFHIIGGFDENEYADRNEEQQGKDATVKTEVKTVDVQALMKNVMAAKAKEEQEKIKELAKTNPEAAKKAAEEAKAKQPAAPSASSQKDMSKMSDKELKEMEKTIADAVNNSKDLPKKTSIIEVKLQKEKGEWKVKPTDKLMKVIFGGQ